MTTFKVKDRHPDFIWIMRNSCRTGDAYYCFCDKERLESLKTSVSDDGTDIVVYDKHCLGLSKEEEVEKPCGRKNHG